MDIFEAAKVGKVTEILKHVGQIEALDQDGNTVLIAAATRGHVSAVKALINIGAQLDVLGKGLHSALSLACKLGRTEVVKALLDAGASVSTTNEIGETPLHYATLGGYDEISGLLLEHGADINAQDKEDKSPLYVAADNNVLPMVKLLLKKGADVNARIKGGTTSLIAAVYKGYHQVVLHLMEYHADPNITTSEAANSALYWASKKGLYAIAKTLLDTGANPFQLTESGISPFSTASDEPMRCLILSYQNGGPSWLVEQLCARGLEWPVVCDIEDKLLKEGFVSKEIFLAAPMSLFTHEYLRSLGITHFGTRLVVIAVRLEGTWLGARLAGLGVSPFWIRSCETCVFEALGCGTKKAFVSLPAATALSAKALKEVGVPVQYHLVLRALHEQLGKARDEQHERERERDNDKEKKITTTTEEASVANATNSAAANNVESS